MSPTSFWVFSFLFLVVSCGASLFLSFLVFRPFSVFIIILRGRFVRSLRCLFLVRCLVSAFIFFTISGFSLCRWTFPSVLLLLLSQGACRSFYFVLSWFGSTVPLRVASARPFGRVRFLPCIPPVETGEDGLCCSRSAFQTQLGPSSLLEEGSGVPHCFCCSFVLWGLPGAQTGGNGQGI